MPRRVEDVEASAEALVVNGPRVDGEQSHEQDQIPSSKHHLPDLKHTDGFHFTAAPTTSVLLTGRFSECQLPFGFCAVKHLHFQASDYPSSYLVIIVLQFGVPFLKDHPEGAQRHQQTMTHIPKHHRKQEGECNDGVHRCRDVETKDGTGVKENQCEAAPSLAYS